MNSRRIAASIAAALVMIVPTAQAGVRPYLRASYSGSQLKMNEVNSNVQDLKAAFVASNIPADLTNVGPGYGPSVSAGLWLLPVLRIGGFYSYHRATVEERVHVPGIVFYDDQLDFRMTEFGGEAAVRFVSLAGLTIGGQVGQGEGKLIEGYAWEDAGGQTYLDDTARRIRPTYGAFIGLDQTNGAGFAGFIRFGYLWRNMGNMPSSGTLSDGTTSVSVNGQSVGMDYSGFNVQVGIGFDAFSPRP